MNLDETTIAELFQKNGYATGAFGKWHNGMQFPYHPNGRGFDLFYGFCSGHWGDYFDPMLEKNGRIVSGEGFCIDDFTSKAIAFMESSKKAGKPFFAYLPYNTPHSPMQVPDNYWKRFANKKLTMMDGNNHLRCALAMCENLDFNVGRILKKLDALQITKNTIVVWFHDNGPNGPRWNGGLRGRKGSVDEGGCKSPLFIKWPGKISPGTTVSKIASARDLLPTLCEFAEISDRPKKPLDGKSLVPLIREPGTSWEDRIFINQWGKRLSVRSENHRLDQKGKLYDMVSDPGQKRPIKNPEVRKSLEIALAQYRKSLLSEYGPAHENRPFVIAHPGSPLTQLPARDGKASGQIKRSNRFPNDSYFLNWTRTEDKVTWEALAGESGEFEVTIYHATAAAGARMRLSFRQESLDFTVPTPHNVPIEGEKEDRSPRMESYTKAWKPLKAGVLTLKKGRGTVVLEALEIPSKEALEVRLITLEKIR
jgi:arylsulfatase A-like enzyme